jgi:hypothetical protein
MENALSNLIKTNLLATRTYGLAWPKISPGSEKYISY